MQDVIESVGNDLKTLNSYRVKYDTPSYYGDDDFEKSIIEIAKANNLFDTSVIDVIDRVEKFLQDNSWFNALAFKISSSDVNDGIKDLVVMSLKYKKYRLNAEHYTAVKQETNNIETLDDILG